MADTTQPVSYELAEQVRRLTEENERLRARVAVEESGPPREPREPRRVWRSVVVVVLLALATILAPAATIAGWARVQLTSADVLRSITRMNMFDGRLTLSLANWTGQTTLAELVLSLIAE